MKRNFLIFTLLTACLLPFAGMAQQAIITDDNAYNTAASGAMLDVKSTSKGFMPPRIALTSLSDQSTIVSPAAGLMVYNTATAGTSPNNVIPGLYFWTGSIWSRPLTGGSNSSDYMAISNDGTVRLLGTATTWNDLVVNPALARNSGATVPVWMLFVSPAIYTWGFEDGKSNEVSFCVQLPHDYKEGSTIYPHIHWSSTTAAGLNRVRWVLDYQWANFGDPFSSSSSASIYGTQLAVDNSKSLGAYDNTITPMNTGGVNNAGVNGNGKKVSSLLMCRLYRDGTNGVDTFTGTAALLSIDFHYEIDSFGSNDQFVK